MGTICNLCGKEKEGIQTGLCNHCGRFGKTDRELALEWWNTLPRYDMDKECKEIYAQRYYQRSAGLITGLEIEEIWKKETQTIK